MNQTWLATAASTLAVTCTLFAGCGGARRAAAAFDPKSDACTFCRMVGSNGRTAAQIVAPGEEPRFFDDLGCLRDFLRGAPPLPDRTVAFVVDHQTGTWVDARTAIYSVNPATDTPMGSHLLAHASAASHDSDPASTGSPTLGFSKAFAGLWLPGGVK